MTNTLYKIVYEPSDGSNSLDAHDAAQAMLGMARSLAILSHYAVNGQLIKQAPSLKGARILATPPERGSFQLPFQIDFDPQTVAVVSSLALSVLGNYVTDLTRFVYRKIAGLSHKPLSEQLKTALDTRPGDFDAITDAVNEDVIKVHRPLMHGVQVFNIYGGDNQIGTFNNSTLNHAKARELGPENEEFVGTIASLNANTDSGRIWLGSHTTAFKRDRSLQRLPIGDRQLLSWSLDQYTNGNTGSICLIGKALRNREGAITVIFVIRSTILTSLNS